MLLLKAQLRNKSTEVRLEKMHLPKQKAVNASINATVVAVHLHCGAQGEAPTLSFSHQTPTIVTMIVFSFQYRYTRNSFIKIPRNNDVVLPVPC